MPVVQLMPKCDIRRHTLTHCLAGPRVGRSGLLTLQQLISVRISKTPTQLVFKPIHKQGLFLTLFAPAYLTIPKNWEGGGAEYLNMLGLGGVRVPIIFGNDLLCNDLPYSKGLIKMGCL